MDGHRRPKTCAIQTVGQHPAVELDDEHARQSTRPLLAGLEPFPGHPDQQRQQEKHIMVIPDDIGRQHHRQGSNDLRKARVSAAGRCPKPADTAPAQNTGSAGDG